MSEKCQNKASGGTCVPPQGQDDATQPSCAPFVSVPVPIPCDPPNEQQPQSGRKSHRATSCASSATIAARKLQAEAKFERKKLERFKQLLEQQQRVEECELRAELAALDTVLSDKSKCSSINSVRSVRTKQWVEDCNANVHTNEPMTHEVLVHAEPSVVNRNVQCGPPTYQVLATPRPTQPCVSLALPTNTGAQQSDIARLASSISKLAQKPKPVELIPFHGSPSEWLLFKASYEESKHSFSVVENLISVRHAVRGAAREAVAAQLFSAMDPDKVLSILELYFARPELIVLHEVAAIRNVPKLSTDSRDLNKFACKVRNCVATIKSLKQEQYIYSPELFDCIISKLSHCTQSKWRDYASIQMQEGTATVTKLELLSLFLLSEAEKLLKFGSTSTTFDMHSSTGQTRSGRTLLTSKPNAAALRDRVHTSTERTATCIYCKKEHNIKTCSTFKALSIEDRWTYVRSNKLCYRCLKGHPHKWNTCKTRPCGLDGCTRRHNQLLHGTPQPPPSKLTLKENEPKVNSLCLSDVQQSSTVENLCSQPLDSIDTVAKVTNVSDTSHVTGHVLSTRPRVLLKVVPVVVRGPAGECDTYALLDDGSTATLIDSDIANRIGAIGPKERMRIDGVGGMTRQSEVCYVSFYIRGSNMPHSYLIRNARSIISLALSPQTIKESDISNFTHLSGLIENLCYTDAVPTVLIGAADWFLTLGREFREGKYNEPTASKTLLGWTLFGPLFNALNDKDNVNHVTYFNTEPSNNVTTDSLDALIKSQYHIDSLGISIRPIRYSADEQRAIEILESTARRLDTGRFEVGLPWRNPNLSCLPDSYPQALSRLRLLENQMAKSNDFGTAYKTFMSSIIDKGYAEECASETYYDRKRLSSSSHSSLKWYLPHFGVYHPQKKKLRVVHDAAAVTKGVSLNSLLLTGPDLLQSLLGILFRFREGKVALTADIREMFPQIKIREQDRDVQRFLWRNGDSTAPIKEYRMSSMIFGAVSSPCTALFIKDKNALEYQNTYPLATHSILTNHYMDDFLGSEADISTAAHLAADIVTLHSKCCFQMRSWISNKPEALRLVPKELWANPDSDVVLPPNDVCVLGVKWSPFDDTLGFRLDLKGGKLTKRVLLSNVMRVYDPLGLLTFIVIKGRILIQGLWKERLSWDDELPASYSKDYQTWLEQLTSASIIRLPRWYMGQDNPVQIQLHMFSDASEEAYACVGYWRFLYADNSIRVVLIASKARVVPLKPVSIPRLELQAALISVRLATTIKTSHRLEPTMIYYWTDSMTVLRWLRTDARIYKSFVAHRVGEISETTDVAQWHWLPSSHNVADDATRSKPTSVDSSHRWFTGPSFLLGPPEEWPTEPTVGSNDETLLNFSSTELKTIPRETIGFHHDRVIPTPPVPDYTRFSKWLRLLRATACVICACRKFRSFVRPVFNPNSKFKSNINVLSTITASDVTLAEEMLFARSQLDSFPDEYECLQTSAPFPKDSRLRKISLCLGKDGLIHLSSRIRRTPGVSEDTKSPIILNGRHHIARLLLRHYHEKAGHANRELILNEVKQRFWIVRCRNTLKALVRECLWCRRHKDKPLVPPMGDLPVERLEHHCRPFTNVGVDYFGPLNISIGRRREKRYVALFTCLVTRAVHLEIAACLSADSAIMCLRRLIARRGCPKKIFSDNGTAFIGANNQLRDFAATIKIEWHFIPPSAPFMGGSWERLIKSVKVALKSTVQEIAPKEETLHTLLLEAESLVNSRPLTYVTTDPDTLEAITPFHFLIGTSSTNSWLAENLDDGDLIRRCNWKRTLRLADLFWARWIKEYLPSLALRPKGVQHELEWKVGDVVLIIDSNLPRGSWPLARVQKLLPGVDGIVRVVDLIIPSGGTMRRPTRKLVRIQTDQTP